MSTINPGELKDNLIILGVVSNGAIDENGFPIEGTQELFPLRCKKKTISTREFIDGARDAYALTYKFICRNRNIDNTMQVKYKNDVYDIKHVHEIDDFFIEITAEKSA